MDMGVTRLVKMGEIAGPTIHRAFADWQDSRSYEVNRSSGYRLRRNFRWHRLREHISGWSVDTFWAESFYESGVAKFSRITHCSANHLRPKAIVIEIY